MDRRERTHDRAEDFDVSIDRLVVDLPEAELGDERALSEDIAKAVLERLDSLFD